HGDLSVTRGNEGRSSADHPGGRLHGSSRQTGPAGCESDACEGTNKHADDVDAAEDAMELEVSLADSRGEIDGADQKSEDSGERVRDEEMAVGDDLQTVGVVHRIVGDE